MNKRIHNLYLITTLCASTCLPLEAVDWRAWLADMYKRYRSRSVAFQILLPATAVSLAGSAWWYSGYRAQQEKKTEEIINKLRRPSVRSVRIMGKGNLDLEQIFHQVTTINNDLSPQNLHDNDLKEIFDPILQYAKTNYDDTLQNTIEKWLPETWYYQFFELQDEDLKKHYRYMNTKSTIYNIMDHLFNDNKLLRTFRTHEVNYTLQPQLYRQDDRITPLRLTLGFLRQNKHNVYDESLRNKEITELQNYLQRPARNQEQAIDSNFWDTFKTMFSSKQIKVPRATEIIDNLNKIYDLQ